MAAGAAAVLRGALGRIGGVFVHPRTTLLGVLAGGGSFFEVLPWMFALTLILAPTQVGQAALVARTDPAAGVRAFFSVFASRMGTPLFAAMFAAAGLLLWDRARWKDKRSLTFDRSFDACAYALWPFFLLATVGALSSRLGLELSPLPHRLPAGRGLVLLLRLFVGYGWPLVLYGLMLRDIGHVGSTPKPHTRDQVTGRTIAVLMVIAFLVVGRQAYEIAMGPALPRAGDSAPEFSARRLDGMPITLAEYRGRVVLLDFWATWCPPCVAAMPGLERVYSRLKSQGFVVLGVNQEPDELENVRRFVQRAGITFPIVVESGEIAPRYGVYSYPTSALIDQDGVVQRVWRGSVDERTVERDAQILLERTGRPQL